MLSQLVNSCCALYVFL